MPGLLNSFVPEFPIPSEPGISFGETVIISCRLRPALPGRFRSTDIRKTRCDLRHALDCDFVAVTSRTLPQSARTTYSFELLFTYSLTGTSDLSQSPFPANCGLSPIYIDNTGNLAALRKPKIKLALNSEASVHSADLLRLQNL